MVHNTVAHEFLFIFSFLQTNFTSQMWSLEAVTENTVRSRRNPSTNTTS